VKSPSIRHLDTNIVIAYLNGQETIAARLKSCLPDVAISSLVFGELLYGARASQKTEENLARLYQFLRIVDVVDFDQTSAEEYSKIRLALRKKGRPTGEMDVLVAAIALAHHAILVTDNVKHFQQIEGLTLENWLR